LTCAIIRVSPGKNGSLRVGVVGHLVEASSEIAQKSISLMPGYNWQKLSKTTNKVFLD